MPIRLKAHTVFVMSLFALAGCAAPFKALMGEPVAPIVDGAARQDKSRQEEELRAALMEKGKALLDAKARGPQPSNPAGTNSAPVRQASAAATAPRAPSPAIEAMLARAKSSTPPHATVARMPEVAKVVPRKDETRFQNSPNGSLEGRSGSVVIRFADGESALDAEGNRALADLARRSELVPSARIVLVAGLSGAGAAWERMQVASQRLDVVARHVPPPLRVERRFELELENHSMRLELYREAP